MARRSRGTSGQLRAAAALTVLLAVTSACGSSVDHDAIVAAWDRPAGGQGADPADAAAAGPTGSGADVTPADGPTATGDVVSQPLASGTGRGGGAATPVEDAGASGAVPSGGAPIKIGSVSALSGPAGAAQAPGVDAVKVWVKAVNAAGGINGHQVQLFVVDDAGDPARHVAALQDLVENKGVIAFVGNFASQTNVTGRAYLERKQIPVVGGDATTPVWFESPMFFPGGAGIDPLGPFGKILSQFTDGRRMAFITCTESAVCSNARASATAGAPKSGFTIVYNGSGSLAQPDFTSECIAMRDAKADVVVAVFDSASVQRVARSCSRQGYHPKYYLAGGVADASFAANPVFDGSGGGTHAFPFSVPKGTNPAADEFLVAMARYAPSTTVQPISTEGWVAGKMFERAAARVGRNPTTQEILTGLWTFKGETLGGLASPRTFSKGAPAASSTCAFIVGIKDGKWLSPRGMEPVCG